jgi:hypothetical protein
MTSARGLARALARRAGRSYVAGRGIAELERVRGAAERRGFACDVCYWPLPGEPPESVARNYAAALEVLAQTRTGARLAVKASQVGFEPATLEPRLDRARRADLPVIYDALEAGESDGVFRMISAALNSGVTLGCALAGRWPRSVADLEWALEHGLHVRLVKGQYADPDHPDADPRAGFLRLVDALAGRAPFVSVATHEPALAREALQRLDAVRAGAALRLSPPPAAAGRARSRHTRPALHPLWLRSHALPAPRGGPGGANRPLLRGRRPDRARACRPSAAVRPVVSVPDRARRGGSGALYSQSALARPNSLSRGEALGVSTPSAASMARSRAMQVREPGQVRKEAALSGHL